MPLLAVTANILSQSHLASNNCYKYKLEDHDIDRSLGKTIYLLSNEILEENDN